MRSRTITMPMFCFYRIDMYCYDMYSVLVGIGVGIGMGMGTGMEMGLCTFVSIF